MPTDSVINPVTYLKGLFNNLYIKKEMSSRGRSLLEWSL
jgi:hypothetical protein